MTGLGHIRRSGARATAPAPAAAGRRERGAALTVVAIAVVPLLIMVALVVDVGYAKQRRRLVQSTADAAALAAAQELDGGGDQVARAVAAAKTWAAKNQPELTAGSWAGCSDPTALAYRPEAGNTCISFDSSSAPSKVRVRIPLEVEPQFFGQFASSNRIEVDAAATAGRTGSPPASTGDCGLCAREHLQLDGRQNIQVVGGGTIHAGRVTANWDSTATISPCPVKAVSGSNRGPCPGTSTYPITTVPSPPPDPFAAVPDPPTPPATCNQFNGGQPCNINNASDAQRLIKPGRLFTQGFNISNVTLNLEPGQYFFGGRFGLGNNVTITGTDVILFFMSPNGSIEGTGNNVQVNISAPTTGPYKGIAVYFERSNQQGTAPKFQGDNSTYRFNGSIYAYNGSFTGTGSRVVDVTGQIYVKYWEQNSQTGSTIIRYSGGGSSTPGSGGGGIQLLN